MINWINFYGLLLLNTIGIYVLYLLIIFLQRNPMGKETKYKDEHVSNYYYPVLPYNYDGWVNKHLKIQQILENKKIDIYKLDKVLYMVFLFSYCNIICFFAFTSASNISLFLIFGGTFGVIFSLIIFIMLVGISVWIGIIYDKKITPILTKMLALLINEDKVEFLNLYNKQNCLIKWCATHCFAKNSLFQTLWLHKEIGLMLDSNQINKPNKRIRKI